MRYKITRIKSRRLLWRRAVLIVCALLYMLCFALSASCTADDIPEWMMLTHMSDRILN